MRFGDAGRGRLAHHARLLHLLVVGVEVLFERAGDSFPAAVTDGRVPYAPVDVRASFERYSPNSLRKPRNSVRWASSSARMVTARSSVTGSSASRAAFISDR